MGKLKGKVFRTHAEKSGGHFHVQVFSADGPDFTFAKLGELTMDESDYVAFTSAFRAEHMSSSRKRPPQVADLWPPSMTAEQIEERIDKLCGCKGRSRCDCVSVFNQARSEAWAEHNGRERDRR